MHRLGSHQLGVGRNARGYSAWRRLRDCLVAASLAFATITALPALPAEAAAPINDLSIDVSSARTEPRAPGGGVTKGDPINSYKYILNIDETGTTETQRSPGGGNGGCSTSDPNYPDNCLWQSIDEPSGWAPIYAQGTQDDLPLTNLPDGRYLISVLADDYKMDGAHFCVEVNGPVPGCTEPLDGRLDVTLQPHPLPDGTLRAFVFEDNAPTNMGPDTGERNLSGFVGHVVDTLGEIQSDVYGNPLCTRYVGENATTFEIPLEELDNDMLPIPIPGSGGECVSDADGMLAIPHLGPNRYAVSATPPDGETWIQTTTLEGNHDYDAWVIEGDTGYDTTFARGGEPIPLPIFGFVQPTHQNGEALLPGEVGEIKGSVVGIKTYTPPKGGSFNLWGGNTGTKVGGPIRRPWVSLADLQAGDTAVWVGRGKINGTFDITGVPDGNYTLSWWDQPQDYNLNFINVSVSNGELVKMGQLPLNGWWTEYSGYVFEDANRNGIKDSGEGGVPNFTLTIRHRENNLYDRGQNTATTDNNGYYYFESGYPIGEWTVLEAYSDSYYTTGVTYQADNQEEPTTVLGAGVDVSTLPIIGLSGTMDWGVHSYDPKGTNGVDPRNGGIVGTVSYDTTRNELDPQFAATEDWQPGISGIPVELYATVDCGTNAGAPCDADQRYELASDGSYKQGDLLNTGVTESWERPTGCTARDVDGDPLVHGVDENVLVPNQEGDGECISSFMQGIQFAPYPTDQGNADANFGAAVNGNYGFGDACSGTLDGSDPANPVCNGGDFEPLLSGDYLVHLAFPDDETGDPMYKATGEEDINIGNGDKFVPQVPPPACAGPLHTVDLAGDGTDGYGQIAGSADPNDNIPDGVTVPASTTVDNATFLEIGGSPYEGSAEPTCDTKLVELNNGKSVAPIFNVFTDVPVPARMRTVIIDDINFSNDPRSIMYGEKAGLAFAPVGIYDFANKLQYTTETDFNGIYDVLMPSTNTINCPTPSGVCANMYMFVANDPGIPGRLNPNYNPRFATHARGAEGLVGISTFSDLAPTQVGLTIESPGTGVSQAVTCPVDPATTPALFTVSRPYVDTDGGAGARSFRIKGAGFGSSGEVKLDGTVVPTSGWTDTSVDVTVPSGTEVGPKQLTVTRTDLAEPATGTNGLTVHVLGTGYDPNLYEVGPGKTYAAIQDALDVARGSTGDDLVVVYPGLPDLDNPRNNPRGAYYENLVMASPVKLQGVGPGGFQGNSYLPGSIIDASSYSTDLPVRTDWLNLVGGLSYDGNQTVNDSEGIYVLASESGASSATRAGDFTAGFKASIDGFDIRGGNQFGFPGNVNDLTGGNTGLPPNITTQGGAIFANSYAQHLQITNNVMENNGGGYGTVRIGTPEIPAPNTDQHNENVRIANNRVIANAGTNLAGGIGIFAGADGYEVENNDICGNFSLEYGGGLTVYGLSPNGTIHHNRVYLNYSNDEGGGIMIAGELPQTAGDLSPGTGPVDIYANQIQANMSNDDGGGIRFLMAGDHEMNVYNNMIVNNVSTHEGGGISLNDAPDVRVYNNTIMKNMTTATAITSNGLPAAAGLSTSLNSDQLQETLPNNAAPFSDPRLFNNVFWDNRAGTRTGGATTVTGLGIPGDTGAITRWDLGSIDASGPLSPTNSIIQANNSGHDYTTSPTNSGGNPSVLEEFDLSVSFSTWRQNPGFVDATLVTVDAPPSEMGDYHLSNTSPAVNRGAAVKGDTTAPVTDIDGDFRPNGPAVDAGADEIAGGIAPPVCPPECAAPTVSDVAAAPNPTAGAATVDLTALATAGDPADPVIQAEWFVGADPGEGAATAMDLTDNGGGQWGVAAQIDVSTWADGGYTLNVRAMGQNGGWGATASTVLTVSAGQQGPTTLYFSTLGNSSIPGVSGPFDDSDIYTWNNTAFGRELAATDLVVPAEADVDGYDQVDSSHFYVSFAEDTTLPDVGAVQDEDVVYYNGAQWSVYFDGTANGMSRGSRDLDAISVSPDGQTLYFSTVGNSGPPGFAGPRDDADVYSWNGTSYARVWDASASGVASSEDVDGLSLVNETNFYLSFKSDVTLTGIGTNQDEDVIGFANGTWSVYFDGTANGMTGGGRDLDAIDVP